jgi:ribonuclease PH
MSLAALDAGSVAMRGVAVGVSLAYLPRGEESELVLDPTSEEEARATSRHGFAWAFGVDLSAAETEDSESEAELVWIESEGRFTRLEVSFERWLC